MHIVVIADGYKQNELNDKGIAEGVQVQFVTTINEAHDADAFFYLLDEENIETDKDAIANLSSVVFINAVTTTLNQLPDNCIRINAWPGFLLSKSLELSATDDNKVKGIKIMDELQWPYIFVPDVPGMITPRIISMIVNEAYFTLADEVSTKEEIDIAMKLGTGYPYGPFEWSQKIGLKKIHHLLEVLEATDARYQPSPLLTSEMNN